MKQENTGVMRVGLSFIIMFLILSGQAFAAESPDELYRQGKYAEALEEYMKLDMDNPKDNRFRYNKGCAAYQGEDYAVAQAAFSSALRRADNDDLKFRALYNLGNTAFKQGDYSSAARYFKDAIVLDPQNADARYNLELALAAQKNQDQQQDRDQEDGSEKQQQEKEPGGDEKQKGSKDSTADDTEDNQSEKDTGENAQDQEKSDQGRQDSRGGNSDDAESPEDLYGELSGPQGSADTMQADPGEIKQGEMDKQKAEALLDNITEDRSRFYKLEVPKDKRGGPGSGKNW